MSSQETHSKRPSNSADPAAIKRSVAGLGGLGGLDILVNNAGIALQPHCRFQCGRRRRAVRRERAWPLLATQAAIPHLTAGGRVITIGSAGAERIVGTPGTVYYMTKSALQSFARGLAHELGGRDITSNWPPETTNHAINAHGKSARLVRAKASMVSFISVAQ